MAKDPKTEKAASQPTEQTPAKLRVVCTLPNVGASVSGVAFATVELDDGPICISERIGPEVAQRFCSIEGYCRWEGDELASAKKIKAAIEKLRAQAVEAGNSVDTAAAATVVELTRANQAMAADLKAARDRIEELEARLREGARKEAA